MVTNAALVDIDVTGYAVSEVIHQIVRKTTSADFERSGGNSIALEAVWDVNFTRPAVVMIIKKVTLLAGTASSGDSIVGAVQTIRQLNTAESAILSGVVVVSHFTLVAVDLFCYQIIGAVGAIGDCAVAGCAGVGVEIVLPITGFANSWISADGAHRNLAVMILEM